VHSFRLPRKRFVHASRAAQLHANCLRPVQCAIVWRLPLAFVSELAAVPTDSKLSEVENRHTAPAALPWASQPRAARRNCMVSIQAPPNTLGSANPLCQRCNACKTESRGPIRRASRLRRPLHRPATTSLWRTAPGAGTRSDARGEHRDAESLSLCLYCCPTFARCRIRPFIPALFYRNHKLSCTFSRPAKEQ